MATGLRMFLRFLKFAAEKLLTGALTASGALIATTLLAMLAFTQAKPLQTEVHVLELPGELVRLAILALQKYVETPQ